MSEPFLAEIRIVGFNFAPRGWAFCDGQILPINQNQSLYSLLGTTYGGDGRTTFALPDLRGRTPIHVGEGFQLGQKTGSEAHTLSASEIPAHTHVVSASNNTPNRETPENAFWSARSANSYSTATPNTTMQNNAIASVGGGQAHNNMQPFLVVNAVIALAGLFPSRN